MIIFILSLFIQADVKELGNPSFYIRDATHKKIKSYNLMGQYYSYLNISNKDLNFEAQKRCEEISFPLENNIKDYYSILSCLLDDFPSIDSIDRVCCDKNWTMFKKAALIKYQYLFAEDIDIIGIGKLILSRESQLSTYIEIRRDKK